MEKVKKIYKFVPVLFFGILTFILFHQFFLFGKIPIPADILIGHYHPWKDMVWEGRTAGYPIKNFILFDGIRQTFPWRVLAMEQIKAGILPLWNPFNFGGTPLLGNLQTAALYPLNLLFLIFPALKAWGFYIALQPFLASLFMYLFLKNLSLSGWSSVFGAVAFGFSGMILNHLELGIDGHTFLWLPLSLFAVSRLLRERQLKHFLLLVFSVSMTFLGGYPPPMIYSLVLILIWSLISGGIKNFKSFILVFLAIVVAFFLTAPQNLPAIELALKVDRRPEMFGPRSGEAFFVPYENLLMALAPDFFGHPSTGNFFARTLYTDNPYIGVLGLFFVTSSLLVIRKKEVLFGLGCIFFSLLLMLQNPMSVFLSKIPISFFSLVSPMRLLWVTGFGLSLLASVGIEETVINKKIRVRKLSLPILVALFLLLFAWRLANSLPSEVWQIKVAQRNLILPTLYVFSACGLLILVSFFPKLIRVLPLVFLLILSFDLLRQGIKYNPFIPQNLVYPRTKILDFLKEQGYEYRVLITHPELFPPNANIPYQIAMVDGYASIYDQRYAQMVSLANVPKDLTIIGGYPRIVFLTNPRSQIVDLLNVKWVLSLTELDISKLKLVAKEGKTLLYQNEEVFPKAFFVQNFYVEEDDLSLARRMLNIDLRREAVLEKNIALESNGEGETEISSYKPAEVKIQTKSEKQALLVLSESFDPGWDVFVDGEKGELLRTNFDLMSVTIPSGEHEVKFIFQPQSFKIGLVISLLSFFTLLGFVGYEIFKSRSSSSKRTF